MGRQLTFFAFDLLHQLYESGITGVSYGLLGGLDQSAMPLLRQWGEEMGAMFRWGDWVEG